MTRWEFLLPRGRRLQIGCRPLILGILNATPDSFSDGGRHATAAEAVEAGLQMIRDGADVIDVGGESTRPGALPVSAETQIERILPVIGGLRERTDAPISVDTQDAGVADKAFEAGADILNDVSACRDPGMRDVLGRWMVPVILMHMKGNALDMQVNPEYPDGVVPTVGSYLKERLEVLESWGIERSRTILDPGIGFGKRLQHNFDLIRSIDALKKHGRPILVGTSRKGFIAKALTEAGWIGADESENRDLGTLIVNAFALMLGCHLLRVHNVRHASALVRLFLRLQGENGASSRTPA